MHRYSWMILAAALLVPSASALPASAEERFTLGKAVPADVYVYTHAAHNPEQEFLQEHWSRVHKAFEASGIVNEVHDLIAGQLPNPGNRQEFEAFWTKAGELIRGVDWKAKIHEFVYTSRIGPPGPGPMQWTMPDYLVLLRYDPGPAKKNAAAFAAVLKEIATAVGGEAAGVRFISKESRGATIWTLGSPGVPFSLRVARRGGVVAISADSRLLDESLALLEGKSANPGLVKTERFRQAMAKLPPAENMKSFFDLPALLNGIRGIVRIGVEQSGGDQEAEKVLGLMGKVLDEFELLDYVASTSRMEGRRELTDTLAPLAPNAEKKRLYGAICQPPPIKQFDRYIPKEATGYSVWAGVDLQALYAAVLDFIAKEVPDGQRHLVRWDALQQEIGFNPQRDVLSWLSGPVVAVSLPAAYAGPFSAGDWAYLLKVRDEEKARRQVKAGMDKLNAMLTAAGQPLTIQPATIKNAEGFRTITHPMMMMVLNPVYGFADGHLVLGSSPGAVEACLATAKGQGPSVAKNARVIREGLIPNGPVYSASFSDLSAMGQEISMALRMVGMVSGMMPSDPQTKPVKDIILLLGKLAPVFQELDFFVSQSAVTTFDGKAFYTRQATSYKGPSPK